MGLWAHFLFWESVSEAVSASDKPMATSRQAVLDLLEPVVVGLGFELVDLELHLSRGRGVLRIFIDHPAGINVDHCETVSRQVSAVLDVSDPIPAGYSLEVSSPGLDRKLARPADFDRFAGADVQIKLRRVIEGRKRLTGTLIGRRDDEIEIRSEAVVYRIPLVEVDVARLVPDMKPPARVD